MLDIKFVRENIDLIKDTLAKRQKDPLRVDKLLLLDNERRSLIGALESIRKEKNVLSKNLPSREEKEKAIQLKKTEQNLEEELKQKEESYKNILYKIPNLVHPNTPIGKNEADNKVLRSWGKPKEFDFPVKNHLEIGVDLGIIDMETAGKITGAKFGYLKNEGALLEFALINLVMITITDEKQLKNRPFIPVIPPIMIKPEVFTRMGRLDPGQEEERYFLPKDNLYLIGSAEHTLGPMHMDTVLDEEDLPLRYVGFSTSLRREAGSYGKYSQGIFRVHQFDKLEMESFTLPEESEKEQDLIVSLQEKLMQSLEIPYQVMAVCTGDMGDPDFRQIDINAWLPSTKEYKETHTSDLMTDYQSRRLSTRVKRKNGQIEFVHMNDATAFAIGRTIIAILENYQQEDGSVIIPKVLVPYMMGKEVISKK